MTIIITKYLVVIPPTWDDEGYGYASQWVGSIGMPQKYYACLN